MRAFVMAAGKGTRLAPLTDVLPKPAFPVANEPVMGRLLRLLARQGVREVVSNISYMADEMEAIFGDGSAYGVHVTWSREPELLGTAGGFKHAEQWLRDGDELVIVLSGDGLHDADLLAMAAAHRASGAVATLGLTPVSDPSEYGVAICSGDGRITAFQEKPAAGTELSNLANTGIYVFSPEVFDLLPDGFYDWGGQFFPRMLEEGRHLQGVVLEGYWNDIGGLEAYRDANLAAASGEVASDPARESAEGDGRFGADVIVHPTATIAPDVSIAGPSVVGPDTVIEAGARLSRVVLLPGAHVPAGTVLAAATYGSVEGLRTWSRSLSQPAPVAR